MTKTVYKLQCRRSYPYVSLGCYYSDGKNQRLQTSGQQADLASWCFLRPIRGFKKILIGYQHLKIWFSGFSQKTGRCSVSGMSFLQETVHRVEYQCFFWSEQRLTLKLFAYLLQAIYLYLYLSIFERLKSKREFLKTAQFIVSPSERVTDAVLPAALWARTSEGTFHNISWLFFPKSTFPHRPRGQKLYPDCACDVPVTLPTRKALRTAFWMNECFEGKWMDDPLGYLRWLECPN